MKKILKEWRGTIIVGLGIVLLGLFLRVVNLTLLPVFGDEAIYIRWAQIMGALPSLRFLPLSDGKQPLFMWILMFIVRRFSDPLYIGRLISVSAGLGTMIGIFFTSLSLSKSKKVALVSLLFWAISPYSVFYDRLALVDSLLTMFGVWVLYWGIMTAKHLRLDFAMLTGFCLGGALLTKSPALFFIILLPLTWIVSKWPKRGKGKTFGKSELVHLVKLSLLYFISLVIGFGLYNILRLGENFHLITSRNQDYIYPVNQLWTSPLNPFLTNVQAIYDWLWSLGPMVLVIFLIATLLTSIKKRPNPQKALLFLWFVIPLAAQAVYAKVFTARYILFTLPSLYIFSSLIFSSFKVKKEYIKKSLVFGLLLYLTLAFKTDYQLLTNPHQAPLPRVVRAGFLEEWTAGTGISEVADIIREEYLAEPEEKIVVGTEGYFGTLPDALQAYLNDLPEITVIGVGLDIKQIPTSLVESRKAGNKTYLAINSTRFLGDAEELGLELIAVYPKAFRPDGSRESLLFFQLK